MPNDCALSQRYSDIWRFCCDYEKSDAFYFISINDDRVDSAYEHAIFVRREGCPERYRLLEAHHFGVLHYIDGYIVAYAFIDSESRIVRINTQTGEVHNTSLRGSIIHVDHERREILLLSGAGFHRVNFNGTGEQLIVPREYIFLSIHGDTIYFQRELSADDSFDTLLYAVNRDGSELRRLISIPLTQLGNWVSEPSSRYWERVQQLEVYGEWIYFTLGVHQGTVQNFYGGLFRMRTDGRELKQLFNATAADFFVMDGQLYFSMSSGDGSRNRAYRIPADLSAQNELLGEDIILHAADGRLFYATACGNIDGRELRSRNPDGSGSTLLFSGSVVPRFEHSYNVRFFNIRTDEEYMFFSVDVFAHTIGDSWRGHLDYRAAYRVRNDGSELVLIDEVNMCWVED